MILIPNNIVFETERLIAKKIQLSNAKELFELESKEEVVKYVTGKVLNYRETEEKLKKWITNFDYEKGFGVLILHSKKDKEFIGICGLIGDNEVGYRLLPKHWRKGFGTEVLKGLITHASNLGMKYLIAEVIKDNIASVKILEKLGFKFLRDQTCANTGMPEYVMELIVKER